jgi:hypothetical protein
MATVGNERMKAIQNYAWWNGAATLVNGIG